LGSGQQIGISLTYFEQEEPKGIPQAYQISSEFIGNRNVGLILGDNIFLGQGMGNLLKKASQTLDAEIFAFPVKNPEDYGVVVLDGATNKIVKIVEKPKIRQSNLAIPGLYFTNSDVVNRSRNLKASSRGELEITDVLNSYLSEDKLEIEIFRRGIGWMDAGSVESLYSAGELIRVLQERQGLRFGSPEEIAWRNGWISSEELLASTSKYGDTSYGVYLNSILADIRL
jgi:glucose-1-phosphate thymidylyltransferase